MRVLGAIRSWRWRDRLGSRSLGMRVYVLAPIAIATLTALVVLGAGVELTSRWYEEHQVDQRRTEALVPATATDYRRAALVAGGLVAGALVIVTALAVAAGLATKSRGLVTAMDEMLEGNYERRLG